MKKLFLIHTINGFMDIIYNPFGKPFAEKNPDVQVHNICDDSLLKDTLAAGKLTNDVARRILFYATAAEAAGADAVMVTCTSVNEAAAYARRFCKVPVFNIDEPTVRDCVLKMKEISGKKVGVLATLPTSPKATIRLLEAEAAKAKIQFDVVSRVAEGAFDVLTSGDRPKHDEMVRDALYKLAKEVDVITFAQISMSLVPHDDCGVPLFKIGTTGFVEARRLLDGGSI